MIYTHWSQAPWESQRWPNFKPQELACKHCGEFYHDPFAFDCLQRLRASLGPIKILSGHRCWFHNQLVGGATNSQHKQFAADVAIGSYKRRSLYNSASRAGFTAFGFYRTFLHCDTRKRPARWFGKGGKESWTSALATS